MTQYLLILDNGDILDTVSAYDRADANAIFTLRGWVIGEVLSAEERYAEIQQAQMEMQQEISNQ